MINLFLVMASVAFAGNIPAGAPTVNTGEVRIRAFNEMQDLSALAEIREAGQADNQQYQSILLGTYYHLNDHWRAGVFYQRQYGVRHDEDWQKDTVTGWGWINTSQRGEDLAVIDLSPKLHLGFLPGETWTLEFKNRYEYNFFDQDQNLHLRQTLTYFWLKQDQPFLHFFLQCEQVFPLNYGVMPINEQWTYLGMVYQRSESVQLGFFAATQWQSWANTSQFSAQTGNSYVVSAGSNVLGFLAIFKMGNHD